MGLLMLSTSYAGIDATNIGKEITKSPPALPSRVELREQMRPERQVRT